MSRAISFPGFVFLEHGGRFIHNVLGRSKYLLESDAKLLRGDNTLTGRSKGTPGGLTTPTEPPEVGLKMANGIHECISGYIQSYDYIH